MEEFSGATPVSVEQESYINMLCSNLCAIVKNDADEKIAASSRPDNKSTLVPELNVSNIFYPTYYLSNNDKQNPAHRKNLMVPDPEYFGRKLASGLPADPWKEKRPDGDPQLSG